MLDHDELRNHFTEVQQKDIVELNDLCLRAPPGRIRRPRFRKPKPNHIPRPVNSFMSYRTEKQSLIRKFCPAANHREISKIVANWWHATTPEEKAIYVAKATAAKNAHAEKYPDYVFRPKSKKTKTLGNTSMIKKNSFIDVKPTLSSHSNKRQKIESIKQETPIVHSSLYQDDILFGLSSGNNDTSSWDKLQLLNSQNLTSPNVYYPAMPTTSASNVLNLAANFSLNNEFLDPILTAATAGLDANLFLMNNPSPMPNSNKSCEFAIHADDAVEIKTESMLEGMDLSQIYMTNMTPGSQVLETPILDYFQSPATHTQHHDFIQTLSPTNTLTAGPATTMNFEQLNASLINDMPVFPNTPFLKPSGDEDVDYTTFNKLFTDYSFASNSESLFPTGTLSSPTSLNSASDDLISALNHSNGMDNSTLFAYYSM